MSPSWYDVLGVEEDASPDQVRTAWRTAVADLDPTDRRFGVLNEAAAVLLDPARRAEYDAERGAATPTDPAPADPAPVPAAPAEEPPAPEAATPRRRLPRPRLPRRTAAVSTRESTADDAQPDEPATSARPVPTWLLLLLAVCVAALVASGVVVAATVPSDEEVREATREAQAVAERAIVPVLSYDFRTLDEDREDAVSYLTDEFRADYEALFSQIQENAPSTRTVVDTEVLASAIVRGGTERADVLLFIDQPTTNAATTEPVTYRNQVTVRLERVDGRWLVDDLVTTPGA